MKILLISDTHGNLDKVFQVLDKVKNIDLILHCGDYQKDAHIIEDTRGIPVISVKGNCDGGSSPDHKIAETPYGNILITHGHMEGVNFDYTRLLYLAEEKDCIAACFGHTHVPMCEDFNGIHLINPGSLSQPRDGSGGSYAVLHSTDDDFYANIVYYDDIFGNENNNNGSGNKNPGKKKVQGGFLRGLLNYSDRF